MAANRSGRKIEVFDVVSALWLNEPETVFYKAIKPKMAILF